MTVSAILAEKGRDVFTESESTSLLEVCRDLGRRRIGAVIITNDKGEVTGVLSERDVVRRLANEGAKALERTVGECMTREVETCRLNDTIAYVMQRMTAGRFRHLPVVEDGKLIGVVSIGDVVKERIEQAEREAAEIREYIATA